MVLAGEYANFASIRKPLRVSRPQGKQRSTFWLQVPYKYSVLMLSASALLHWLIARSLFFVKIDVSDPNGNIVPPPKDAEGEDYASGITGCAYSPGAALAALALWTAFIATLLVFSLKRLHPGIPVAGSCSRALSAASHSPRTDVDAATLPLQYGVYTEDDENGIAHEKVGFCSESVTPYVGLLPYYQYESAGPQIYNERWAQAMKDFKPTVKLHTYEELPARPHLTGRQTQLDRGIQRDGPSHVWAETVANNGQADNAALLAPQQPQTRTGHFANAGRDLQEDIRQSNGTPPSHTRQELTAQVSEEIELLTISSRRQEDSRRTSAASAARGLEIL